MTIKDNNLHEIETGHQCCGQHKGEHECGCSGHDHDHDHDHDHEDNDLVTLILEDGTELKCPIIDIFDVNENQYIALFHPIEETALLYTFHDYEDGTIEIDSIEDDAEFELVSTTFMKNMKAMEEEE